MRHIRGAAGLPSLSGGRLPRQAGCGLLALFAGALAAGCAQLLLDWPAREQPLPPAFFRADLSLREAFSVLPGAVAREATVDLLDRNTEAWAARWRLLEQATRTLDISYFILKPDIFGASFLGHLLEKAQQGVRVRLLLDAQGTAMARTPRGNDYLDELANARNVAVKIYRPLLSRYVEALLTLSPVAAVASNHDKIMVFDHRVALMGGRNISVEYFADPRDLNTAFEDVDVVVADDAASAALTRAFEALYASAHAHAVRREMINIASHRADLLLAYQAMDAWLRGRPLQPAVARAIADEELPWLDELNALPHLRGALARLDPEQASASLRVLDSELRLGSSAEPISQSIVRLVRSAAREILVVSPYLVLSEEAAAVLEEAGRRGVEITILTNSPVSSDNAMSQAFFLEQWPELLARVPNLRIFVRGEPRNLHGKVAVFDHQVGFVGTYNLDPLSMGVNSEVAIVAWSETFAHRLAQRPRRLLAEGPPEIYEYRIQRDGQGNARRDAQGKVMIEFGPEDHSSPEQWTRLKIYWGLLKAAGQLPGFSPLL